MGTRENERKKVNKIAITVLVILLLFCLLGGLGYLIFQWYSGHVADESYGNLMGFVDEAVSAGEKDEEENRPENPIDFASLKAKNDDVYAWIKIPNTKINYPVVQSRVDDNFYLNKSIDKKYLFAGMIYSQSCNSLDFFDPVTVLYGHNMKNGTMFQNLHKFQDAKFFEENDTFYVYTETHILTYKVVSAFKYDNRHIMNSFDFNDPQQLEEFQNTVINPDSFIKNVRSGVELNQYSKLLVLSTCINDRSSRYLVCGVMIDDEKTK